MNLFSFSKEKQERDAADKRLSEQLLTERRVVRQTLDEIARSNNPHDRRNLAAMLVMLAHDHGYTSGRGRSAS